MTIPAGQAWNPVTLGGPDGAPLVTLLLAEQGDLTAVERFSQFHEGAEAPLQGRYYSALMPASPPGPGEQLAFEVDLDRCSGCKACVSACHSLNGLDEGEAWRDVGMILGGPAWMPILQHVTSSCHHCLDPACLNACPVDAYEKDPVTGIVKHLDDQCFGCQYCTLACPYDAPKFHKKKGIVRKCDMCSDRLGHGEAPACVQACPHEAIRIRVVDRLEVTAAAGAGVFLASAPGPGYTQPTTRYVSSRPFTAGLLAADHHRIEPEHAHTPLVVMLVMTQLAVGGFLLDFARLAAGAEPGTLVEAILLGVSVAFLHVGLVASTCHLGRPLYAYRALIGLRHSWLSREIATFGLFSGVAINYAALAILRPGWFASRPGLQIALSAAAVVAGFSGLISSVMVYHVVRRPFWRADLTGSKFAGTALVLGLAAGSVATAIGSGYVPAILCLGLMAATVAKLAAEAVVLRHLFDAELTPLRRSAILLSGPLLKVSKARLAAALIGGLVLPAALLVAGGPWASAIALVSFLTLLGGELAERYEFFAAVTKLKMPGGMMS